MEVRERLFWWLTCIGVTLLMSILVARGILREIPGTNSFGALAEAFLNGRLDVVRCPEIDCAVFNGRTYIIFPPLPAILLMPVVALTGFAGLKGLVFMGAAIVGIALFVWSRIFMAMGVNRRLAIWLLVALGFASPLYQIALRADGVWFFAQTLGFLMATLSLWAVICRQSLVLAGLFVALAFLCRQMSIFYPLFLVFLAARPDAPLIAEGRRLLRPVLLAGIPVVVALLLTLAYNAARFGNPFETGYAFISNPGNDGFVWRRIQDVGIFSVQYVPFNLLYLFLQGIHFEFSGPHLTTIKGLDKNGVALLVASPWLIMALFARVDRVFAAGMATILIIVGIMLFYHSNGADQFNSQRYVLDWLPILIVLMLRGERAPAYAAFPVLVTWGVLTHAAVFALNIALRT